MANNITFTLVGAATSQWYPLNWMGNSPMNVAVVVELVSGSASYTVQYTYDDPNNLSPGVTQPLAFVGLAPAALGGGGSPTPATGTADGLFTSPFIALQVVNTDTGTLRVRILQAGIG